MRVIFEAQNRDDGTMVVTCPQLPVFHVIAEKGREWQSVFEIAKMYMQMNGEKCIHPTV